MALTKSTLAMTQNVPINVCDYGADNTGVNDCSAAITSALAIGTNLYFPPGTYKLTSAVTLPAGAILRGEQAIINVAYDGDGFITPLGRSNSVSATVTSSHTVDATNSVTKSVAVVSSATGYAVGDLVVAIGTDGQSFYSYIQAISGTTFTLSDYAIYTLTSPTLYKITPANITISGLTMYHGISTPTVGSYLINIDGSFITIENCSFGNSTYKNSYCISGVGAFNSVTNCNFNEVAFAVQIFEAAYCYVGQNTISNFGVAIRCVRCDSCQIIQNDIQNGTNLSFGLGIELTAETGAYDKNCRNIVDGNTVIRANKGVPGSGIGGIHLNFAGNYNRIVNNTCRLNSFGIYLENDCSYNVIDSNICSDQDGWYGVGIELDFDCSNNTISNNVCQSNRGSTSAAESSGIQIRDYTANPCLYNTITGNSCEGNGLEGIRCGGNHTTVTGNVLFNNAVDVVAMNTALATNYGWGIRVNGSNHTISGNIIDQDSFDSRASSAFSQYALNVQGGANVTITSNYIYSGFYSKACLFIEAADNVIVANNTIITQSATGYCVSADGLTDIYVNTNFISQTNNGNFAVAILNTNRYSLWGNVFTGAVSTTTTVGSSNRYTPGDN